MLEIFIEDLRDGHIQPIEEEVDPDFLDVKENELQFNSKVHVVGKCYITLDELIIEMEKVQTYADMPCKICNETTKVPLELKKFYHVANISKLRSLVYDYSKPLREELLLEIPLFTECENNCPKRKTIKSYCHKQKDEYFPFAQLDTKKNI